MEQEEIQKAADTEIQHGRNKGMDVGGGDQLVQAVSPVIRPPLKVHRSCRAAHGASEGTTRFAGPSS